MRIGIHGGSFDPVHEGHVHAARTVRTARGLDAVWLVPTNVPPHKEPCAAPFSERLAMVRIAIEGVEGLAACGIEGERPGPSYSADTVEELSRRHPDAAWELLVGADMLADLPRWHRAHDLLALVTVVAFGRPGEDFDEARASFSGACPGVEVAAVELDPVEVSSTRLRARLPGAGRPPPGLPPAVFRHICQKGLYGAGLGG